MYSEAPKGPELIKKKFFLNEKHLIQQLILLGLVKTIRSK